MDAVQVGYDATRKEVRTPLLNLVAEVFVDIIQHRNMDSVPMRNIETLTQSERFMTALSQQEAGCQEQISPVTVHLKHQMNKLEEQHHFI